MGRHANPCGGCLPRSHYQEAADASDAVIFVLDTVDRSRIPRAQAFFREFTGSVRAGKLLLVANKADLPGAMTEEEVAESFAGAPVVLGSVIGGCLNQDVSQWIEEKKPERAR